MDTLRPNSTMLHVGEWRVDPRSGEISRNGDTVRLEARTMRLLLCLADHAGEVVSIDDLLNHVWEGVAVSQDSVYQAIASLRRQLGDDSKQPTYIATVPRIGYRLVAQVTSWEDQVKSEVKANRTATSDDPQRDQDKRHGKGLGRYAFALGAALCLAVVVGFLLRGRFSSNDASISSANAAPPQKSVVVLPFLDLTEGMQEEEFADGMTEELIGRLSKVPGLRVPAPTSSFYYKGKQVPVADIAKTLGVSYVLDGSVRKSGDRLRVAARLVRAENGYVVWSESYDRSLHDILMVQDDIAGEVTKALKAQL
jgi:transcriptional activator of cad operon